MKIRKVDDKPMVIHTKEKAKIHAHEPKGAKIKGSNIYTVERGPKTIGAKVSDDKKKSYRKSTIHQSEPKNKGLSRFKRNLKESNISIKTKNTNIHIAGRTGALAAGAVTEQVEGGQEVSQAAYLAYESSRPVTGTASKGAALFRKKAAAEAKKRIKKVEAGKKLAKKTAKKAAKDTAKTVAKETAKETAKITAKVATKTATKAAATAAGTAVAPGVGTAIGMVAGYAAGVSIEVKDEKMTNRSRKIKFFLDKMKAQENQTDSVAKLVKDLIVRKAITWVKAAAPIIGLVLLLLVLVVATIAVPVIAAIAILYNSPFALFLPPLESGDTVQTVTSAYVQEFNRDVNTKVNEHTGYDLGELVYVDYEGMEETPSNYYDIMAVYMVKHGVGDTATVMNDTSKGWLQAVVNDMCSYTTSTGTKDVEETDADGNVTTVTKSVLYVNVTLKSYRDMISVYGFNSDHVEMLEQIMSPEFMGQLGYAGSGSGGGGGSPGVSSMTEDEINAILNEITDICCQPDGRGRDGDPRVLQNLSADLARTRNDADTLALAGPDAGSERRVTRMEGRIIKALSGYYYVDTGAEIVTCRARGKFRLDGTSPLVGDRVRLDASSDGTGSVREILPRRNYFIRPAVANIDLMVMLAAAVNPVTDPFLIDRVSALAAHHSCDFLLCINKADLDSGDELFSIYSASGIPVLRTSAVTGEGLPELSERLAGRVCAFTGNSGVGKSSLLNALSPELSLLTGEVSQKLGRGRHTTRHVELFALPNGGYVADTPGFGSFDIEQMESIRPAELQYCFPEFEPYLGACRFTDCTHRNEPDCAVNAAADDGAIHPSRLDSYRRLWEQANRKKDWEVRQTE